MNEQSWTVIGILTTTQKFFEEKGIESPRQNAEALLCKVLQLPRIELYLQHDRPLSGEQIRGYRDLVRRRVQREPLQLILGSVEFYGLTLEVSPGLLIPRPETEELVEHVLTSLKQSPASDIVRVLDIGTGTGCIAAAIASSDLRCTVDAVDVDFEAIRCTERNATRYGLMERVHGILADLFSPRFESALQQPYDVVVSNPPYVTEAEYAELAPEVRDHEARRALVAADNGLACFTRIADLLPTLLRPGGLAAFEIGARQDDAVKAILSGILTDITVHADLAGLPRVVSGQRSLEE
jgi:release factor glutamine methyltransferase